MNWLSLSPIEEEFGADLGVLEIITFFRKLVLCPHMKALWTKG
jgi:hypothetical protein